MKRTAHLVIPKHDENPALPMLCSEALFLLFVLTVTDSRCKISLKTMVWEVWGNLRFISYGSYLTTK